MTKKVLVTGHLGYIGSHAVDLLKEAGHFVTGCDLNLFEGCEFASRRAPDEEILSDFRALTLDDLSKFDCIMHFAAISNDPMGDLDPSITYGINRDGTIALAKKSKEASVPLFLFASSCSIYGKGEKLDIDESGAVAPLTAYAISKIEAENALKELAEPHFKAIALRNATAYGYSPMLRIDLVVNNLLACALSRNEIRVMSDGSPWRPLIHCRDIARAFLAFMETPPKEPFLSVNIGSNRENYRVKEIVEKVHIRLPRTSIIYTGEVGADPRNYRVNFDRLGTILPHFHLAYSLDQGIDELLFEYRKRQFGLEDFEGDRYVRLRTLKTRLDRILYAVH